MRNAIILKINFLLKGVSLFEGGDQLRDGYYSRKYGICSELALASRAPWVSKSTHPRKFGNH